MPCCAITRQGGGSVVPFGLHVRNDNRERTPPLVWLKAVCELRSMRGGRTSGETDPSERTGTRSAPMLPEPI
jgi:hypothetical protein